jgi:DNA mismatch endonuclease (patch repair protein)
VARRLPLSDQRRTVGTKPDLVFSGSRVAVFIDGCFWHGCPEHYRAPIGNPAFWRAKLARNQARDRRDDAFLRQAGWHPIQALGLPDPARVANGRARSSSLTASKTSLSRCYDVV